MSGKSNSYHHKGINRGDNKEFIYLAIYTGDPYSSYRFLDPRQVYEEVRKAQHPDNRYFLRIIKFTRKDIIANTLEDSYSSEVGEIIADIRR